MQLVYFCSKGIIPLSLVPVYTATKAGVIAFTRWFKVRICLLSVMTESYDFMFQMNVFSLPALPSIMCDTCFSPTLHKMVIN